MHNALRHSHWTLAIGRCTQETASHSAPRLRTVKFILFFYWQAKLTCTKQFWYAPISDRPSRRRDSTIWQPCSGWTLWLHYEQRSLIVGLRHRQLFVHNLPVCSNETSDLRQNWTLCDHRTSPLSYHVWAAELGTTRVLTHARIWQVEHASSPPCPNMGSMPGTTSSYCDVIIWGATFLYLWISH